MAPFRKHPKCSRKAKCWHWLRPRVSSRPQLRARGPRQLTASVGQTRLVVSSCYVFQAFQDRHFSRREVFFVAQNARDNVKGPIIGDRIHAREFLHWRGLACFSVGKDRLSLRKRYAGHYCINSALTCSMDHFLFTDSLKFSRDHCCSPPGRDMPRTTSGSSEERR